MRLTALLFDPSRRAPHPLAAAKRLLHSENFQSLSFLGINQNVKKEWRMTHRAFGSISSFSFMVEHMIGMINVFIQHYGAETTLAKKFSASLERHSSWK
jgi:hypothetical protein